MERPESCHIEYLNVNRNDEEWGLVVTTVGYQRIPAHGAYPQSEHPASHIFDPRRGRTLNEYQLVYISEGEGRFESRSCRRQRIGAGTAMLLFPGEWHTYAPDPESGWFEYWAGFRGDMIDRQTAGGFFTPRTPIFRPGFSETIIGLYEELARYAREERTGYQQVAAGIVQFLLGTVCYRQRNSSEADAPALRKIDEARSIMKREIENAPSPREIAERLSVGYSWFRKTFRQYVGTSPAQYLAHVRYLRAKELLDAPQLNISEIAYRLRFENAGQFSTFFRKKEGIPPLQYRRERNASKK